MNKSTKEYDKMSKFVSGLLSVILSVCGVFAHAETSKMASQKWTLNVVSNTTETTKNWVKMNYVSKEREVNPETDAWTEDGGASITVIENGTKISYPVVRTESKRTTFGYYVVDTDYADGVVSNLQFYANVGNGMFKCAKNETIPYIIEGGLSTQVVDNVTNVYQKLIVEEYAWNTNGTRVIRSWSSQQLSAVRFNLIYVATDGKLRSFGIQYGIGDALNESPMSSYKFDEPLKSRCIADFMYSVFIHTALAAKLPPGDIVINGKQLSGTITITAGQKHLQTVTDIPIEYYGPLKTKEDRALPDLLDPESGKIIHRWEIWDQRYEILETDWNAEGNWLPDYAEYKYKIETEEGIITKTKVISRSDIQTILGSKLTNALKNSWPGKPTCHTNTIQEAHDCNKRPPEGLGHYYEPETCRCRYCMTQREHHLVQKESDECYICDNRVGWEHESFQSSQECGGRSDDDQYHVDFHHEPKEGYKAPEQGKTPGSEGYENECMCQCGKKHFSHEYIGDTLWYIVAGNTTGDQEDDYHTKVYVCTRCGQLANYFGWKAFVEAHIVASTNTYPCYKGSEGYVAIRDYNANIHNKPNSEVGIDETYHVTDGKCAQFPFGCGHDVKGLAVHTFNLNPCKCDTCNAVLHKFYDTDICEGLMVCRNCQQQFEVDDFGHIDFDAGTTDIETYRPWHEYGTKEEGNLEHHYCNCMIRVPHKHNWTAQIGTSTEICDKDKEDGTDGCGLTREHSQETHESSTSFDVYGKCGNWRCATCNKVITEDDKGNTLPTTHAGYVGDVLVGSIHDYTNPNTRQYYCACCYNAAGKYHCGSTVETDKEGNRIIKWNDPVVLNSDWRLHHGWTPDLTSEESAKVHHYCQCRTFVRDHTENVLDLQEIAGDNRFHNARFNCISNAAHAVLDACNHIWKDKQFHSPFATGVYHKNTLTNEICDQEVMCRISYVVEGQQREGCGHKWFRGIEHDMTNKPPCTAIDDYLHHYDSVCKNCNEYHEEVTNDHARTMYYDTTSQKHRKYNLCDALYGQGSQSASHVIVGWDEDVGDHNLPCNREIDIIPEAPHDKAISHGYRVLNGQYHVETGICSVCRMNLPGRTFITETNQLHTIVSEEKYYKNDSEHNISNYCSVCTSWFLAYPISSEPHKQSSMSFRSPKNSQYHSVSNLCYPRGCGSLYWLKDEAHTFEMINPKYYVNNRYHSWSNKCTYCDYRGPSGQNEFHDRYGSTLSDVYVYSGLDSHIGWQWHNGSNNCNSCNSWYLSKKWEDCEYNWGAGGNWILDPDTNGLDEATCYFCKDYGLLDHNWAEDDEYTHHCANGGGHLYNQPHVWQNPVTSNKCVLCEYERPVPPMEIEACQDYCGCYRETNSLGRVISSNCGYSTSWKNGHCGCYYCQNGHGELCLCEVPGRILCYGQYPVVGVERFKDDKYKNMEVIWVNGDDPVFHVKRSGFEGCFSNCYNLVKVTFNALTNAESSAFKYAFHDCPKLENIQFNNLITAGDMSFEGAFSVILGSPYYTNANAITEVSFPSLKYAGDKAFHNAFCESGVHHNIKAVRFPSLVSCASNAFKEAFSDCYDMHYSNIAVVDFSSVTNLSDVMWFGFNWPALKILRLSSIRSALNGMIYWESPDNTTIEEIWLEKTPSAIGSIFVDDYGDEHTAPWYTCVYVDESKLDAYRSLWTQIQSPNVDRLYPAPKEDIYFGCKQYPDTVTHYEYTNEGEDWRYDIVITAKVSSVSIESIAQIYLNASDTTTVDPTGQMTSLGHDFYALRFVGLKAAKMYQPVMVADCRSFYGEKFWYPKDSPSMGSLTAKELIRIYKNYPDILIQGVQTNCFPCSSNGLPSRLEHCWSVVYTNGTSIGTYGLTPTMFDDVSEAKSYTTTPSSFSARISPPHYPQKIGLTTPRMGPYFKNFDKVEKYSTVSNSLATAVYDGIHTVMFNVPIDRVEDEFFSPLNAYVEIGGREFYNTQVYYPSDVYTDVFGIRYRSYGSITLSIDITGYSVLGEQCHVILEKGGSWDTLCDITVPITYTP